MQDTIFQVRMVLYPAIIRKYDRDMKLRYNYRLYPTRGQSSALARAFECARVTATPRRISSPWDAGRG